MKAGPKKGKALPAPAKVEKEGESSEDGGKEESSPSPGPLLGAKRTRLMASVHMCCSHRA